MVAFTLFNSNVPNLLGVVGPGSVFQVFYGNCYRYFENAEKIFREKEKQPARGRKLAQK